MREGVAWNPAWRLNLPFSPSDPGEDHDTEAFLREPVRRQPAGGALIFSARKPAPVSVCLSPSGAGSWGLHAGQPSPAALPGPVPGAAPSGKAQTRRAGCTGRQSGCWLASHPTPGSVCLLLLMAHPPRSFTFLRGLAF